MLYYSKKKKGDAMSFIALVYHEVRDDLSLDQLARLPLKAANAYTINLPPALVLSTDDFKRQMTYLVEQDFHFLSMQDIKDFYEKQTLLPDKSIFISFDDAYQSLYTTAYPILKELGIPATLFLVSAWLFNESSDYNTQASQVMSWPQVEAITDVFELAYHTHDLHNLLRPGASSAMQASFEELKADLDSCSQYLHHLDTFAYPFGFYNDDLLDHLARLNIRYAFTTKVGTNTLQTPRLQLNRALVYQQMPFEQFKKIVQL